MSGFGGKADMTVCGSPLSRSLLGVKRTWARALHMSAFDPKRTLGLIGISAGSRPNFSFAAGRKVLGFEHCARRGLKGAHATAPIHCITRRCGCVAASGACAAG